MSYVACQVTLASVLHTLTAARQHNSALQVLLEIGSTIPDKTVIDRWCSEPLAAVIVPTSIWLTNPSGYPVLSKAHQALVKQFLRYNVQVIVRGSLRNPKGPQALTACASRDSPCPALLPRFSPPSYPCSVLPCSPSVTPSSHYAA